jgi:rhamnosyltransferase
LEEDNFKLLSGCVIIYNPKAFIIGNIKSYLNYLDVLYIIDNSEIADLQLINSLISISSRIIYVPQNKNIGVASAFNVAAGMAVTAKYGWLLTMDQDSYFPEGEFFDIWSSVADDDDKVGLLAASYTNKYDRWQKEYSKHFNEIHFAVSSGNIINLGAWDIVKGFEDKLFIDEVDHDYCLRLRKNNYKILISKNVLMQHMVGEFYEPAKNNLSTKEKFVLHNPVRYYYMSRNVLFVCKKYFFVDFKFVLGRLFYLIKLFGKILLYYPDKMTYLKFFLKGITDFLCVRYDKYSA